MTARAARIALLLVAATAPACFDVRSVDPGGVLIDDFDDGDFVPTMLELDAWQCYAFNPRTNPNYHCDHDEGFASPYSLFVDFYVEDTPDDTQQFGGAGLTTSTMNGPIDLTPYRDLILSLRLRSGTPAIPSEAVVYIELYCRTVPSESGAAVSDFYIVQPVTPTGDWSTLRLALTNWGPPPWQTEHIKGGTQACLRAVDSISISLAAQLKDGQAGRGTFFIDNLRLQ